MRAKNSTERLRQTIVERKTNRPTTPILAASCARSATSLTTNRATTTEKANGNHHRWAAGQRTAPSASIVSGPRGGTDVPTVERRDHHPTTAEGILFAVRPGAYKYHRSLEWLWCRLKVARNRSARFNLRGKRHTCASDQVPLDHTFPAPDSSTSLSLVVVPSTVRFLA